MLQLVEDVSALGLAGNQINFLMRLIVVHVVEETQDPLFSFSGIMVNPQLTWTSGVMEDEREGCLSIPDVFGGPVPRDAHVRVTHTDVQGCQQTKEMKGLLARCVQHEIDHLNGILYFDYMPEKNRINLLQNYKKKKHQKALLNKASESF